MAPEKKLSPKEDAEFLGLPLPIAIMMILLVAVSLIMTFKPEWVIRPWMLYAKLETQIILLVNQREDVINSALLHLNWLSVTNSKNVTPEHIKQIALFNQRFTWYLYSPVLLAMAAFIYFIRIRYDRKPDMESFLQQEAAIYSHIYFFLKHRPDKTSLFRGPWRKRASYLDLVKQHKLLIKDKTTKEKRLNRKKAQTVFARQLGPEIQDFCQAPHPYSALAAIFSARIMEDTQSEKMLLDAFNVAYADNSSNIKQLKQRQIQKILSKASRHPKIEPLIKQHAYWTTLLQRLLIEARKSGELASARMPWIKLADRTLWYVINDVGRPTASAESAGPRAHYLEESESQTRSSSPQIEEAIKALEAELIERGILPEPEDDTTQQA